MCQRTQRRERFEISDGLCGELEENLIVMIEHFVEIYRKRDLKVIANKSKGML